MRLFYTRWTAKECAYMNDITITIDGPYKLFSWSGFTIIMGTQKRGAIEFALIWRDVPAYRKEILEWNKT